MGQHAIRNGSSRNRNLATFDIPVSNKLNVSLCGLSHFVFMCVRRSLADNALTGVLPNSLMSSTSLKTLLLEHNMLSGAIHPITSTALSLIRLFSNCFQAPTEAVMSECAAVSARGFGANCTILPQNGDSVCESPDVRPLLSLYSLTDGPRWRNSSGWNSSTSVCSWFGISCDESLMRVVSINLSNNSLFGSIPAEIAAISELKNL